MTLPTSGVYANFMQSFLSNLTPAQQQGVWSNFLTQNDYTTNPSNSNLTAQSQFAQYVQGTLKDQYVNPQLSPDEIAKRQIMINSYYLMVQMLQTMQNTVAVQSTNLIFYGQWQQEYTTMMSEVPIYTPTASSATVTSTTNPNSFTFGYNNISAQDIAQYVLSSGQSVNVTSYNSNQDPTEPSLIFTFSPSSVTITYAATQTAYNTDIANLANPLYPLMPQNPDSVTTNVTFPPAVATDTTLQTFTNNATALATAFVTLYNSSGAQALIQNALAYNNNTLPGIDWRLTAVTNNTTLNNQITQERGEVNTRNQQLIQNIQSQSDIVSNTSKEAESNLQDTRDSVSNLSDLLTSIIQSMQGLISAIFK